MEPSTTWAERLKQQEGLGVNGNGVCGWNVVVCFIVYECLVLDSSQICLTHIYTSLLSLSDLFPHRGN